MGSDSVLLLRGDPEQVQMVRDRLYVKGLDNQVANP